jgi:hypothetical protein
MVGFLFWVFGRASNQKRMAPPLFFCGQLKAPKRSQSPVVESLSLRSFPG